METLKNKVAVVFAASGEIAGAVSRSFAQHGAKVYVTGRLLTWILKKALAGDINSFQTLFAEFQNQLRSYLYRLLTDRNDVHDLTHDTFIRAFDKIATFNQDSSLKTWVFRIATNLAYDHLRKLKR